MVPGLLLVYLLASTQRAGLMQCNSSAAAVDDDERVARPHGAYGWLPTRENPGRVRWLL
jgi:hypothetical protein